MSPATHRRSRRRRAPDVSHFVTDALERMADGFVAYDRDWRVVYMNKAAEHFWERGREGIVGRVLWDVFPQILGTEVEQRLRRAMAAGGPTEFESFSLVSHRWSLARAFPSESGVAFYFKDITARKEDERALKQSEARFRALFENSIEGVALTAPDGRIFAVNPAGCAIFARTEAELVALGRDAVVNMDDPRTRAFLAERRANGRAHGEVLLKRPDDSRVLVELSSSIFNGADGDQLTALSFHDITERKRAEASLALLAHASRVLGESLDYTATVQNLAHLVVTSLAEMCFVDVWEHGQLHRLGAAHRNPELEVRMCAVVHDASRSAAAGVRKVFQTGELELVPEITDAWLAQAIADPEGARVIQSLEPRSALMVPLLQEDRVLGVLSLVRSRQAGTPFETADVPLAQELAGRAALAIQNARLYRAALEAKKLRDETLGVVSHDLRSPLNTIHLAVRVLEKRGAGRQEVEAIDGAVRAADQLIQDLLAAAAADAGRLELHRSRCAPAEVVRDAVELHRLLAASRGIELRGEADEGLPELELDRHRIAQVLANLIGNALKFTPGGGQVAVAARRANAGLELSVSDSGPGIPPEHMERIFDRFWQGNESGRGGVGLGLSIAKGVAEAHGGRLRVASEPGRGATFTVFLPVARSGT